MFNKVIYTFSTRVLTAILSVVNVLIGTNYLGVEGYGTISLIVLGITIYLMIQNLITGSSLVYFISRFKPSSVLLLSYIWVVISVALFIMIVFGSFFITSIFGFSFEIVPKQYAWHTVILAFTYGIMATHMNILLGRERIKSFNFIFLIQHLLATVFLFVFYIILKKEDLLFYIISLYLSYFLAFLTSFVFTLPYLSFSALPTWTEFKSMIKYGILGQSANVFQLLNYRLSYYLIDLYIGRSGLGVFSAATQISEGLWIFGKSIATVLFARISNSTDFEYAQNLSLRLVKFTVFTTLLPLLILIFLPVAFYTFLLGPEFVNVKTLIQLMAVGTLSLSASMILSSYFSGIGQIEKNTKSSGLGVVITIILGLLLIPVFGEMGAAMVSSLSYMTGVFFLIYHFRKTKALKFRDWFITMNDFRESRKILYSRFKK